MSAMVDLHLHTTASDGRLSPTELIHLLASQGLKQVAISDHDTTEGLAEAFAAAEEFPDMRVIPAIELSTDIPGDEVHMLGYFLRHEDEELQKILREFRMGRLEREAGHPGHQHRMGTGSGDCRGRIGRPPSHSPGHGREGLLQGT